jgi:hypothetical protein
MKKFGFYFFILVVGTFIGITITVIVQQHGGRLKISWNPISLDLDFSGAPHQVPINFGNSASDRSLASALIIIQDSTKN